jgi:hypothetical protein
MSVTLVPSEALIALDTAASGETRLRVSNRFYLAGGLLGCAIGGRPFLIE